MSRLYRGFLTAASAAVLSILVLVAGCSGGGDNATAPNQVVRCPNGTAAPGNDISKCSVVVSPETVSFSSVTPSNGSVIAQSASVCPMANVQFAATAVSNKTGVVSDLTYAVDGTNVPASTNVSTGTHQLRVIATAPSRVADTTFSTFTVPQAGISIHLAIATGTGERVPQGARAVVEDADSASFDGQGNAFVPTCAAVKQNVTKVVIVGDAGMIPFLGRIPSRFYSNLNVIGVPTTYTIPSGSYAGQVIPIHLDSAYKFVTSTGVDHLPFYIRQQQTDGSWSFGIGSWKSFPVKVAFFQYGYSAQNTLDMQKIVDSLNTKYGFQALVLADSTAVKNEGGIRLYLNPSDPSFGGGLQDGQGDYVTGLVNMQFTAWPAGTPVVAGQPLYDIITAEIIHTLFDVGHTCSWVSAMQSSCSYSNGSDVSSRDVAYPRLMIRVREMERKYNTRFSMAQAYQGENVMTHHLAEEKVNYLDEKGVIVP